MSQISHLQASKACVSAYFAIESDTSVEAVKLWCDASNLLEDGEFTKAYWTAMESIKLSSGEDSLTYKETAALI